MMIFEQALRDDLDRIYWASTATPRVGVADLDQAFAVGLKQGVLTLTEVAVKTGAMSASTGLRAIAVVRSWQPTPLPATSERPH